MYVCKAKRTRVLLPKLYEPSDECGGRMPVIFICLSPWMRQQICIPEDSLQIVAPFKHQFFLSGTKTSAEVPIKPLLFNVFSSCCKGILLRAFGSIPAVPSRQLTLMFVCIWPDGYTECVYVSILDGFSFFFFVHFHKFFETGHVPFGARFSHPHFKWQFFF